MAGTDALSSADVRAADDIELTPFTEGGPDDMASPSISETKELGDKEALVGPSSENIHHSAEGSGTGGIFRTSFNFTNTIIGSGLIGLPFAMQEAGLPLGILELLLFAVMTDYSVHLLIQTGLYAKVDDYQALCQKAFGRV
jgi:hypothetical protein